MRGQFSSARSVIQSAVFSAIDREDQKRRSAVAVAVAVLNQSVGTRLRELTFSQQFKQ
uniref:Uncharacterized protein n=1 Tax=Utricularia reniformis TaxID=192314 RepID=A0A1Y0B066_9LAMI|nr:hypothetical protein AEK19_MT0512 [Utricularia reniformis]ART30768.1 hypothetical protein AEK19_MT0512 [Utricularia reniformis]